MEPEDFLAARLLAAQAAYRNAERIEGAQETRLDEVLRLQLEALALPQSYAASLRGIELDYEKTQLRANKRVVEIVREAAERGIRLVYASDMYLGSAEIDELLESCGVDLPFAGRYSSADSGLSKRAGPLYRLIACEQGVAPERCLHVGDAIDADVLCPKAVGWQAVHWPRNMPWRLARRVRDRLFRLRLRSKGLVV